jgi:protoheme ferro-lyase
VWTIPERADHVRSRMPEQGMFADKTWRIAHSPFAFSSTHVEILEKLGRGLQAFNVAANLLYRQSVAGKQPAWIAALLDQGKPTELIALARQEGIKNQLPGGGICHL